MQYSELQKKGITLAKKYENMPLQTKIDMIAPTFSSKTGKLKTSSCTGDWQDTRDMSLHFDNKTDLFIGNADAYAAETANKQHEYVNRAISMYHPEIIVEIKTKTIPALLERETRDNEIAKNMGLMPYKILNIEIIDCNDSNSGRFLGWFYVTIAVNNKIIGMLITELNRDIRRGEIEASRPKYFTACGENEKAVDFIFDNTGHCSTSNGYKITEDELSKDAYKRAEETLAKRTAKRV